MTLTQILAVLALACALLLAFQLQSRLFPVVAAFVAGIEVLTSFGILRLSISGISLALVLAAALAVAGVLTWAKSQGKLHVSAATVILLVGAMQLVTALSR